MHCDFKPANVILAGDPDEPSALITDFGLARAFQQQPAHREQGGGERSASEPTAHLASGSLRGGTRNYMAPEILAGAPATVRSDIYSYGRVLSELLPGHRLANRCLAARPEDRPATLEPVLHALGGATRRLWLLGSAAAIAGVGGAAYSLVSRPKFVLASRQRVAVNGFRPDGSHSAYMVRDLLVTALRQSPLLMVMADDRLKALLRMLKYKPQLPADSAALLAAAAREGAMVIDGVLQAVGTGLHLQLQVFPQGESKPALRFSEQVDEAKQVVQLADRAALRLRRELGESAGSLASGIPTRA